MINKSNLFKNNSVKGNNSTYTYGSASKPIIKKETNVNKMDLNKKINNMFKSNNFVYKMNVKITINNQEREEYIIARKDNYLITMQNERINISDIQNIVEITE